MTGIFESAFQFLFKYRPLVYEKGRLAFALPWPIYVILLVVGLALVLTLLTYSRARAKSRRDIIMLATLRTAALAVLLFCLSRPTLLVPTVVPQRNFLGILIDDSRSMGIADMAGAPRNQFAQIAFAGPDSALGAALAERFLLRFFRFDDGTGRIDDVTTLSAVGARTDLAQALDAAQRELGTVPLAGLIAITDGADNSESSALSETLLRLRADSVPVYVIGVGQERFERDLELRRVEVPRNVLLGSSLVVDLVVEQRGYSRQTVRVDVEDEGRIVASEELRLPADGESATARVQFKAEQPGARRLRFRVASQPGELVTRNNEREALVVVEDTRNKILYFEGEPRFEVKFLRRAVSEDDNIHVVTLQRTAENKFLRLDVDDPEELAAGFPQTREELFAYRGLVLGSVEASFFTHDQLRMIEEFVGQRGGGLLVLGGRRALDQGGYAGTPLSDVLPVVLPRPGEESPGDFYSEVTVEATRFGRLHPVTRIGGSEEESAARWSELPAVSAVNRITQVKPGASQLLSGKGDDLTEPLVVLAFQRYGRGKSLALPIQDSWIWQMHADIPLEDMTHETFWRQLLRWLVSYVPDPVMASASRDRVGPGEWVTLAAEVQDETFLHVNNAEVSARVTSPSGVTKQVPLNWSIEADGVYHVRYAASEEGLHRVGVEARKEGRFIGGHATYFEVGDLATEFYDAELRADLLRRVAEETGGRYYTPETSSMLAEDVSVTDAGATVVEERDLWDLPLVFLLLIGLVSAEWGYRRSRGLV
ncbi:MAG: hypothetical protein JSU87_07790 [Gemmatimonadota bacterium]|nr:MAG: hypothetical protein JSU87_07790 [Gemmatimonadota bacterium]